MDVLSDALTAMRTGVPHAGLSRNRAPWGVRFDGDDGGAGFHVVLRGSCWLLPREGEPLRMGPGDVAFLPHGRGHGLAGDPGTPLAPFDGGDGGDGDDGGHGDGGVADTELLCGAYRLDGARRHPLLDGLPEVVHIPSRPGTHPQLRSAIDLLAVELDRPRPGGSALLTSLLDVLLLYLLRAWYEERSDRTRTGWAAALHDGPVSAALRALHRDPAHPWTVASLGRAAGLSRAAFARRFTALVGQPPLAYLTWWRMTLAARLLRDTDLPLRAVAERTGYTSEFAFAKAFKREYGTPPGSYRRDGDGARAA
ncbi:AraC family transcriptional regulator [Streptomyces capparidis]